MEHPTRGPRLVSPFRAVLFATFALGALAATQAGATPALTMDAGSGAVLYEDHATQPWFPASLTKMMTTYVALQAVKDGRIGFDTPLVVSARAASMAPSKMGFSPGTEVTLGNALKMMMVKSANDLAVTVAEGVSGSVEAFADEMNATAARLGMVQSHFANPNGLPDPRHYSSARDLALLGRALYQNFPDQAELFSIGALSLDGQVIANHNNLLGRYPGVDGMKTGFTCAAGFNVVASASRGGKRLIVVVLGAPTVATRTAKAAALLDRGFLGIDRPGQMLTSVALRGGAAPDMHGAVCKGRSRAIAQFTAETTKLEAPLAAQAASGTTQTPERSLLFDASALNQPVPMASRIAMVPTPVFEPVPVYVGAAPGYTGPVAAVRPAGTPVGTPAPPDAASAYAAPPADAAAAAPAALRPDAAALPLKGRKLAAKPHHPDKPTKTAAKPAPKKPAATAAKKPAAVEKTAAKKPLPRTVAAKAAKPDAKD